MKLPNLGWMTLRWMPMWPRPAATATGLCDTTQILPPGKRSISIGNPIAGFTAVGGRPIRRHGRDLGPRATQAFPEGFQGVHAFAVADEHHGTAAQVEHHGDRTRSLADGNFIDGDL